MSPYHSVSEHPLITLGIYSINIRQSIEVREWVAPAGVLYYLCSFSDEVDERFQQLTAQFSRMLKSGSISSTLLYITSFLELTDSILFWDGKILTVIRGGSANFPLYHSRHKKIATSLPADCQVISKSGLTTYMTADLISGINEPNSLLTTPFQEWIRFRRGVLTRLRFGEAPQEIPFPVAELSLGNDLTLAKVINEVQEAFTAFSESQRNVQRSILELSGGFDSTLAGASVRQYQKELYGVSAIYPYYEFQHEAPLQILVADHLQINRTVIDGTSCFPYAMVHSMPNLDEPNKFMTGARFTELIGEFAQSNQASKIYVGHGGDDLFDADTSDLREVSNKVDRQFFTKMTKKFILKTVREMNNPEWLHNNTGLFTYDGRLDLWIKENYGSSIRSPFTDLKVFRSARLWSEYCRKNNQLVDKSILTMSFPNMLPPELRKRKGKIRYEGVWARAYHKHGDHIADLIDSCAEVFELMGIIPAKLIRRIKDLQNYKSDAEGHVIAAFAIANWLNSRNLKNKKDINWVE